MALPTARSSLWPLVLVILFRSTAVTSLQIRFALDSPKTFWIDGSCERKGFTPNHAQESLHLASRGANRLINLYDDYQAWVFKLLFKQDRDFGIYDYSPSMAWDLIGKILPELPLEMQHKVLNDPQEYGAWIAAMKYEVNRDLADVRIYCGE